MGLHLEYIFFLNFFAQKANIYISISFTWNNAWVLIKR